MAEPQSAGSTGLSLNLSAEDLKRMMDALKLGTEAKGGGAAESKGGGSCGVAVCGNGAAL